MKTSGTFLLLILLASCSLFAEHHGQVKFGTLALPGATVTVTQQDKKFTAITDLNGVYTFPNLPAGIWAVQIEMQCFATVQGVITVDANGKSSTWDMTLLPPGEIKAVTAPPPLPPATPSPNGTPTTTASATPASAASVASAAPITSKTPKNKIPPPVAANPAGGFQRADVNAAKGSDQANGNGDKKEGDDTQEATTSPANAKEASDAFLINGSQNNGAASPFGQSGAFGNFRKGPRSLYNGSLGMVMDNSFMDAQSYSVTGQTTPKPGYNRVTGLFNFGGPMKIPHLFRNGPNFSVSYQWTRNRNATTTPGNMPTADQRAGDFSAVPTPIFDPTTGLQFPSNKVPLSRISPAATALLPLFPAPNFTGPYNYQVPLISNVHVDSLQARLNKGVGRSNQISGSYNFQFVRTDSANLFDFVDTNRILGMNGNVGWMHRFTMRTFMNLGYQFSRQTIQVQPFFANRQNIAGAAGIAGDNQQAQNWGPPTLSFASGLSSMNDTQSSHVVNQTHALSASLFWAHSPHNITVGGDFRRQQFNTVAQQDPRGTFGFTGQNAKATGVGDFASFLVGVPDTASIAFGNADKYFRANNSDLYARDDWRVGPGLTLDLGVRWEYGSPIVEKYNRLVNLDIAQGFTKVSPVLASSPIGSLSGTSYPNSLLQPDKAAIEPRLGFAWHPILASSLVVRGGYSVSYDTRTYNAIATQMAQQAPLSTSISIQNCVVSSLCPNGVATGASLLSMNNAFLSAAATGRDTFGVDPNFRVGYAQNWQVSVQRDLPGALIATVTYNGIKGTRLRQQILPNTYPIGVGTPCPACPTGFYYLESNGNSTRESGSIQLRRRLHHGLGATLQYTYSKSIDDANTGGGNLIAQNWLDLSAERGLSTFDQRHLLNFQMQYSTGMGVGGGTLLDGWRGTLFKDWTFTSGVVTGSGKPLSPIYPGAVNGTAISGPIRPDYTGADLYAAPDGRFLNLAALAAPTGHWGNAGRDTIIGPMQFGVNASMMRTFRLTDRLNTDFRLDSTNAINHVTYASWTTVMNQQFGLPTVANSMRTVQMTLRLRF